MLAEQAPQRAACSPVLRALRASTAIHRAMSCPSMSGASAKLGLSIQRNAEQVGWSRAVRKARRMSENCCNAAVDCRVSSRA